MTEGSSQFAVRFVGGKIRMDLRGVSEGQMARFTSRDFLRVMGSAFFGVTVARKT